MKNNNTRPVINDICRNIEGFDSSSIIWIDGLKKDSLEEELKEAVKDKDDKIIFVQAGALTNNEPDKGSVSEANKLIEEESKILYDLGFYNILFARCMGRSYGLSTVFIYNNIAGEKFINDYKTTDGIISLVRKESKKSVLNDPNSDQL